LPSESMNCSVCVTRCLTGPFPLSTVITCFSFQCQCFSVSRCHVSLSHNNTFTH
jgi:hypothetical protein